jgi:hypothetical protein
VLKLRFSAEDQGTTSEGDKIQVPA